MKTPLAYFCFALLFIGCENGHQLTFARKSFSGEECTPCPKVTIDIPHVLEKSKVAKNINTAISEEIISFLLFEENGEIEVTTIQDAVVSFNQGYAEIAKLYGDENDHWEATINGQVTYEDRTTLTLMLDVFLFTGGAHGYTSKRFLNFDKKRGTELRNWQLFSDNEGFIKFAESKFRQQENIPQDRSINHTGFMFEGDSFHLPENIGLTGKGVHLLYNQYEVASFADGPIEVILPFSEVRHYLKTDLESQNRISTTLFEDLD